MTADVVEERIPTPLLYGRDTADEDGAIAEEELEWGEYVLLRLPVGVVRAIRETLRRTPVDQLHGLDGAIIDELNHQLCQQVEQ